MINCSPCKAVGLALLVCAGRTAEAQPLISASPPIVIKIAEIDRAHVYLHPPTKPLGQWRLSVFFKDLPQTKVDDLVRQGLLTHRPVWFLDDQKVVLKTSALVGEAITRHDETDIPAGDEFGLVLGFTSREGAEQAATILGSQANSK